MALHGVPIEVRLWSRVTIERTNECWMWNGTTNDKGYGRINHNGKVVPTHRVAYELLVGAVPVGLELDHLCRNRLCCNPTHMEAVSHRENTLRSPTSPTAVNARRTHCKHGHEFTVQNTYYWRGVRKCRECNNGYGRKRRALSAAKEAA